MSYDLRELLQHADKHGYAIPAFNYSDSWEFLAILEAAREMRAPVICQSHMRVVNVFSEQWLGRWGQAAMETAPFPVINHLDHSDDVELCLSAIDCGYQSVMFDGSMLDLDTNIQCTSRVVEYAHRHGNVCVEGEVGRIRGTSEEGSYNGSDFLVRVEDAVWMAEESKVDSLAVGIGNAHGFYQEKPQLNFERLRQVNDAVQVPLVLHGGTGIPDADIQRAIRSGINKVNIGTYLHAAYRDRLRETLNNSDRDTSLLTVMISGKEAVKQVVRRLIRICMAENRF